MATTHRQKLLPEMKFHIPIRIQHEALLSLLLEKGIITQEDYLDKVRQVTEELQDRQTGQ